MSRVLARATVNLPGLAAGRMAMVDPSNTDTASLIRIGYLVLLEPVSEPGFASVEVESDDLVRRREVFAPQDPA